MKLFYILLISVFCFSFRPPTEKVENNSRPGFYIFVEDFTDRTNHKYLVESKDSVNEIFNQFFSSELALGNIDTPISINNLKLNFYVARVTVFETPKGKKKFRNLKYPNVFVKRKQPNTVVF